MQRPICDRTDSLRFLLYLEWVLLSIVLLSEIGTVVVSHLPRSPLLNLICLGGFTLLGLFLPQRHTWHKLTYTGVELVLILVMSRIGGVPLVQLLYVVLVIRNCLIFESANRTLITVLAVVLSAITQLHRLPHLAFVASSAAPRIGLIGLSVTLLFGLVVLFLQLLVDAVLAERRSREQLAIANTQLREYALKVESIATLQERNRIAREIHDSLGHSLTAFNLHLEAALRLMQSHPEDAIALLHEAQHLGNTALQDVRHSVATLRAEPLQGISLEEGIMSLLAEFQRSTNVSPKATLELNCLIPADLKIALYRIIQEALTNICKYAEATAVTVTLRTTQQAVELSIQDNGKGFDPQRTTTGFGLRGMQERTIALHGAFEVHTAPNAGCQIRATFPGAQP